MDRRGGAWRALHDTKRARRHDRGRARRRCRTRPNAGDGDPPPIRVPLFSQDLSGDLQLEHRFGQQFLEPTVLGFQLTQPLGFRHRHSSEFASPQVVARLGEPAPSAQVLDRHARLGFPQKANNLFFRKTLLHVRSPDCLSDRTPSSSATHFGGHVARTDGQHTNRQDSRFARRSRPQGEGHGRKMLLHFRHSRHPWRSDGPNESHPFRHTNALASGGC